MSLCIGMGQMLVEGGAPGANMVRAAGMVAAGSAAGCDIVVLPECLDLSWTHPSARERAEPIPGETAASIQGLARKYGVYVAAGLTERYQGKIYNASILADDKGKVILHHRKINILDIARDMYSVGTGLNVVDTPWGKVGMLICADLFPETRALGEAVARMGAKVVLSPSAWAVPADHDNRSDPYGSLWQGAYRSLSLEFEMSIVGVSNVGVIDGGPWAGHKCIGCSLAMGPGGKELFMAPYGVDAAGLHVVHCPV
jgi:predicted amidohydrolase